MIRLVLTGLVCLGIILGGPGCGKKGPPRLKGDPLPLRVERLVAVEKDGRVLLRGEIIVPEGQDTRLKDVVAVRLYHTWYPAEAPPCEGCPVDYPGFETHPVRGLERGPFSLEVQLKRKAIHYFEVLLTGRHGEVGPPSNRAKLLTE